MTKEEIAAIRQLTIGQAKEAFKQDYSCLDEEDSDYINEKVKLDSYCEGVEDVLKILKGFEMTKEQALEQQPCDETIKYLECNDIDVQKFTEAMKKQRLQVIKPNICDDCISRQAVIDMTGLSNWFESSDDYNSFVEDLCKLPPVTPTQCIAAVRFSKDDLREICNERIEIECTHGTCKDCEYWHKEGKYCTNLTNTMGWSEDEYYQVWTDEDFYCKDFKKRGDLGNER